MQQEIIARLIVVEGGVWEIPTEAIILSQKVKAYHTSIQEIMEPGRAPIVPENQGNEVKQE